MNATLFLLNPYPFERLSTLLADASPPDDLDLIRLTIGEPQHPSPDFVLQALTANLDLTSRYPATAGLPGLRACIVDWLNRRYDLKQGLLDPDGNVLPVNGTREGLFAIAQALVDRDSDPLVILPNPCYQIYEGATLFAGAQPLYLPCTEENGFIPDFHELDNETWKRVRMVYLCSPGNPTGAVHSMGSLKTLIALAESYNFVIVADECYAEIYQDEQNPPPGLLQAAQALGNDSFHNCLVFHSLSKRSNLPGLRSGFVAGDATLIRQFLRYRTYHGCAMPLQNQHASIAAWSDEAHVRDNRARYREKYAAFMNALEGALDVQVPPASFYLWARVPGSDEDFARELFTRQHVAVTPGSYLGRAVDDVNPGAGRIRIALVDEVDRCAEAGRRILQMVQGRSD